MMTRLAALLALLLLACATSAPAAITTWYLDATNGSDANAGTSAGAGNAWQTLGKAVTSASTGDTIFIKGPMTYSVTASISAGTAGTTANPVSFIGYNSTPGDAPSIASGNQPTIALTGAAVSWQVATLVMVSNLTITGSNSATNVVFKAGNSSVISNCKIVQSGAGNAANGNTGTTYTSCEVSGGTGTQSVGITFGAAGMCEACYVHDVAGIWLNSAGGIVATALGGQVRKCLIESCHTGVYCGGVSVCDSTIVNCANGMYYGSNLGTLENLSIAYCGTGVNAIGYSPFAKAVNFYKCDLASTASTAISSTSYDPGFAGSAVLTGTAGSVDSGTRKTFFDAGQSLSTATTADFLSIWSGTSATVGVYPVLSVSGGSITTGTAITSSGTGGNIHWGLVAGGTSTNLALSTTSSLLTAGYGLTLGVGTASQVPIGAWGYASAGGGTALTVATSDVYNGVPFSTGSGTATGSLAISASQIRAGQTIHNIAGTVAAPNYGILSGGALSVEPFSLLAISSAVGQLGVQVLAGCLVVLFAYWLFTRPKRNSQPPIIDIPPPEPKRETESAILSELITETIRSQP